MEDLITRFIRRWDVGIISEIRKHACCFLGEGEEDFYQRPSEGLRYEHISKSVLNEGGTDPRMRLELYIKRGTAATTCSSCSVHQTALLQHAKESPTPKASIVVLIQYI